MTELGVMYRRELDPSGLMKAARRAEELGFDQFWVVEDCFYMGGISQATLALAATEKIKIGIGVNPAVGHNAAILAMEYSTLARAFPGRFIGGIGHGVDTWMRQIGEKVASPLTAMEEITTAMKRLLAGERITVDGRYVKLKDVQLDPPPAEAPPILHGVRAEKSLKLAGRIADGVLLAQNSGAEYISWCRNLMDGERETPGMLGVYVPTLINDKDPDVARDNMRDYVASAVGKGINVNTANLSYTDELKKLIDAGGPESLYKSMPDEWVRDLSAFGTREQVQESITKFTAAGTDYIILAPRANWDWMPWLESSAALIG